MRNLVLGLIIYSCVDPMDDLFVPCFPCDNSFETRLHNSTNYYGNGYEENFHPNGYDDYATVIKRQTQETLGSETFQSTAQSRRVICRRTPAGARDCRLRVDRLVQLRGRTYGRSIQFVQNVEYLTQEDLDLVRR